MEPAIHIENLSVVRDLRILDDVSWRIEKGENWCVLGANGSGKTSLLSALMGYLTPSAGKIAVDGKGYGDHPWQELREQIGLVSSAVKRQVGDQETAQEIVVSGRYAMINHWGDIRRIDRDDAMVLLDSLSCTYLAHRPWLYLSQGERQKVMIARALMGDPVVLILDEPCAGLDPVARESFLSFVNHLPEQRLAPTLVLVTHHIEEISSCISHVLLLKRGRVVSQGEKSKVLNSANLTETFEHPIRMGRRGSRYWMHIEDAEPMG